MDRTELATLKSAAAKRSANGQETRMCIDGSTRQGRVNRIWAFPKHKGQDCLTSRQAVIAAWP